MTTLIVFSKDRAMQLDSLLRSIEDHCTGIGSVQVIAKASSRLHLAAYHQLDWSTALAEMTLSSRDGGLPLGFELDYALLTADHVGFAVDDMIFYRPSNYTLAAAALDGMKAFVWSWRYGIWRAPAVRAGVDFWRGPAGYAWHVDGSLYRAADYRAMLDSYYPNWRTARTPTDLEGTVADRIGEWSAGRTHLGPSEATCMTWQINQAHVTPGVRRAPFTATAETELDALAQAYLDGKRVDNAALYADTSWTTKFQKRPGQTHVEACAEAAAFYASLIR